MICQDIERGEGVALIDPHGDLVGRIAASISERRRADVIYFNVLDRTQPYGYNPLRRVSPARRSLAASGLLKVLRKTWDARSWGCA